MSSDSLFDLSDLAVESVSVMSADAIERATEGHGMTELAGSCNICSCVCRSTPSFVVEDDIT